MGGRLRHRTASDRGAAAVEFALVSILLMIMIVGMVQLARLYQAQLAITHAAREGVRQASVNKYDAAYVKQQAAPLPAANVTVTRTEPTAESVKVTVGYPFPIWLVNPNWSRTAQVIQLSSSAEMRKEF